MTARQTFFLSALSSEGSRLTGSHRRCARWAHLPIVFSTGHGDEKRLEDLLQHADIAFLQKPYSSERLEGVLRRVIHGAQALTL